MEWINEINNAMEEWAAKALSILWKIWTYAWRIISNLIAYLIAFLIFNNAHSTFESLVFSLLMFIYLNINAGFALAAYSRGEELFMAYERFKYLRRLLKEDLDEESQKYEAQDLEIAKKKWREVKIKFWINTLFSSILWFITLFNILRVLLVS